ncbi:MAG: hypothetical protein KA974_07390 [Saprospiraceae bacterium]|nr:hypothetical protein [Saprospiraceae bacterium]MBP7679661.1 hypothetical protein [Saprospiraceae bacterium]
MKKITILSVLLTITLFACKQETKKTDASTNTSAATERLKIFKSVKLTTDITQLSADEKQMIPLFIEAAKIMDGLFWQQAYGNKDSLLSALTNVDEKRLAEIYYGPWDRLDDDKPFIAGVSAKPLGANFYPTDMTKEELEKSDIKDKKGQYSLIRRDANSKLIAVPYSVAYKAELEKAAALLNQAAAIAKDASLKKYLSLRANALLTDNYTASDMAWLDMKTNGVDFVVGPIENYEDKLYNARTAYEAYILVKDHAWSKRLEKYVAMLPALQQSLPVAAAYKKDKPGTDSQLNAYDVVYYAGDCNSGSKTIAVNLPNDETIQQKKGTRRSQLKNVMRAKFDHILKPIADALIDPAQAKHIKFDAFFSNVMFHEVAHGLGVKNPVKGKTPIREALAEDFSALEEGKADVLGLFMVSQLIEKGELKDTELMDHFVTYMAGIIRSVRFGAASAHGKANMLNFNYFQEQGAFTRNAEGKYSVNFDKFKAAMTSLAAVILQLQGDADKAAADKILADKGIIRPELKADLDKLSQLGIPVDLVFEQGTDVLGLK